MKELFDKYKYSRLLLAVDAVIACLLAFVALYQLRYFTACILFVLAVWLIYQVFFYES